VEGCRTGIEAGVGISTKASGAPRFGVGELCAAPNVYVSAQIEGAPGKPVKSLKVGEAGEGGIFSLP
jgi:hypothetical protein